MTTFITRFFALSMVFLFSSCGNENRQTAVEQESETTNVNQENMNTIFVGTYTKKEGHVDGQADGILTIYQNEDTGELVSGRTVAEVVNPSFVKVSKDGDFLFAVSELGSGDAPSGYVYSYRLLENDSLEQVSKVSSENFAPAHIELDQSGEFVFVANYMGGVVMLYRKHENGSLQKHQRIDLANPDESHAHSVKVSADNRQAYIADLGNDKIWIFDFDAEAGKLSPNKQASINLEQGAGPRHLALAANGRFLYSMNELNSSVSVFEVQVNGGLEPLQNISSLPEGFSGDNSGADIHLHPSGKFLYVSNRGHNSIAAFEVDQNDGRLSSIGFTSTEGKTPRNFAISPSGNYLYAANQDSNSVAVFELDTQTGALSLQGEPLEVKTPVALEFAE